MGSGGCYKSCPGGGGWGEGRNDISHVRGGAINLVLRGGGGGEIEVMSRGINIVLGGGGGGGESYKSCPGGCYKSCPGGGGGENDVQGGTRGVI